MEDEWRCSEREFQMTAAENTNLLWPILMVLVHSTIRLSWLAESRLFTIITGLSLFASLELPTWNIAPSEHLYQSNVTWTHSVWPVSMLSLLVICTEMSNAMFLLLLWHAPLGVCGAKRAHQSPEWMILSYVNCFIHGDIIGFVLLDSLHPPSTRASWWSPPVLQAFEILTSGSHMQTNTMWTCVECGCYFSYIWECSVDRQRSPAVHRLIIHYGCAWSLIATRWFVCLYIDVLPTEARTDHFLLHYSLSGTFKRWNVRANYLFIYLLACLVHSYLV